MFAKGRPIQKIIPKPPWGKGVKKKMKTPSHKTWVRAKIFTYGSSFGKKMTNNINHIKFLNAKSTQP